jgi:hypothetical protein
MALEENSRSFLKYIYLLAVLRVSALFKCPIKSQYAQMAEEEDQRRARRYQKDLPDDRTNFAKAWKLLEEYSHIPPEDIDAHVIAVVSCNIEISRMGTANSG